jgi:hypothetical protein
MGANRNKVLTRLDRLHSAALDVLLGLSFALSFFMSMFGLMMLYDLAGGEKVSTQMAIARLAIPFIGAGAVHVLIFAALRRWRGSRRLRVFFGAVLPLQALAVLVSYGAHWTHFNGTEATLVSYAVALTKADRGVRTFVQSFDYLERQTAALDAHSERQATTEAKDGGTCGGSSGDGRGPRYELRMSDRETFAGFSKDLAARQTQFGELAKSIAALSAKDADAAVRGFAELRRIVDEAKALESDPLPQQIRRVVEARIVLGRSEIPIPPNRRGKSGHPTFTCFDPILEQRGQAVAEAVKALKPMPELEFVDARNPRTGFALAIGRLYHRAHDALFARKSARPADAGEEVETGRDVPPLLTASLLETMLVLLFMLRSGLPHHSGGNDIRDALDDEADPVFDDLWARLAGDAGGSSRDAVYAHGKITPFGFYVFAPVDGARPEANAMHQMMEVLSFAGLVNLAYVDPQGLTRRWLMRDMRPDRIARLTAGETLLVYKMTRAAFYSLVLEALARDERAATQAEKQSRGSVGPIILPPACARRN